MLFSSHFYFLWPGAAACFKIACSLVDCDAPSLVVHILYGQQVGTDITQSKANYMYNVNMLIVFLFVLFLLWNKTILCIM